MQSPQAKLKQIQRIFDLWPSQAATADAEEVLRGYLLAVEDYPFCDVEVAVDTLVKGTAPRINPSFRPKPSEVGSECRRQMNLRVDRDNRERKLRPALPSPDVEHTPAGRARVGDMVKRFLADTAKKMQTPEAADDARRKSSLWARTNARFAPDPLPAATRKRLGFDVGDMDGREDAA